ncbi:MAG: ferredoxin [Candidatus Aenigmatarchaeota archaeon]|nr:MAG: ferredoxin [Candidatus Aenigmarchaeota archaeon]
MPWINEDMCVGCGICVENCPVDAIFMEKGKAEIDMDECIRCGKCHEACPRGAVRHDNERIPADIDENIRKTMELMGHYKSRKEKQAFLGRMEKHFKKEKIVAEKTLSGIEELKIKC